jgi:hypothetical protein
MDIATQNAVMGAIRSLLVVSGAALATHGIGSDKLWAEVVGPVMVLIPVCYSFWLKFDNERRAKLREVVAVNVGVELSNREPTTTPPVPAVLVPQIIQQIAPLLPPIPEGTIIPPTLKGSP